MENLETLDLLLIASFDFGDSITLSFATGDLAEIDGLLDDVIMDEDGADMVEELDDT